MNIWKTIKIVFIIAVISIPVEAGLRHYLSPQARYNDSRTQVEELLHDLDRSCTAGGYVDTGASAWDTSDSGCYRDEIKVKKLEKILLDPKNKKYEKVWIKTKYDPDYDSMTYYEEQVFMEDYK